MRRSLQGLAIAVTVASVTAGLMTPQHVQAAASPGGIVLTGKVVDEEYIQGTSSTGATQRHDLSMIGRSSPTTLYDLGTAQIQYTTDVPSGGTRQIIASGPGATTPSGFAAACNGSACNLTMAPNADQGWGIAVRQVNPTSVWLEPTVCFRSSSDIGTLVSNLPVGGWTWWLGSTIAGYVIAGMNNPICKSLPLMSLPLQFDDAGFTYVAPVTQTVTYATHWDKSAYADGTNPLHICYAPYNSTCDYVHKYVVTVSGKPYTDNSSVFSGTYQAGTWNPVTPYRAIDTQKAGWGGPLLSHLSRTFQLAGTGQIPATAYAITGNLTVVGQTGAGFLYLGPVPSDYPGGLTDYPTVSSINFPLNDIRANGVTVSLDGYGRISVTYGGLAPAFLDSGPTTDFILDITGFYVAGPAASKWFPVSPLRIVDSRQGLGVAHKLSARIPTRFSVVSGSGVPSNATAVTGNLTVTEQTEAGFFNLGPDSTGPTSTLNFPLNDNRANSVTVPVRQGQLYVTYGAVGTTSTAQVIFDLTGYYVPSSGGAMYVPIIPTRIMDTRANQGISGKLSGQTPRSFGVAGQAGVPSSLVGVTGNLTVTGQSAAGFLYVGPNNTNPPPASTLNFPVGDTRANGVVVPCYGSLWVTYGAPSTAKTDAIFDLTGYFRY
jgi:hypothetical protein